MDPINTGIFDDPLPYPGTPGPTDDLDSIPGVFAQVPGVQEFNGPANDTVPAVPLPPMLNKDPFEQHLKHAARKPVSFETLTQPGSFDWNRSQADRYINSDYYREQGFNPDRDNETLYGNRQTFGDVMENAFAGGGRLAWNTFIDGWKGWGRLVDSLFSWDASKLMGDPEELAELHKEQEEIFNKYAIFSTPESEKGIFNKQFLGNLIQQGGFAVGALAQFATENLLFMGLGNVAKAFTGASTLARISREGYTIGEVYRDAKRLADTWKVPGVVKNAYAGLRATGAAGRKAIELLPVVGKLPGVTDDVIRSLRTGEGALAATGAGFNGLRRTLAEANMAFTEARMEAASTYGELQEHLYNEALKKGNVSYEDIESINKLAGEAAWNNFLVNSIVIATMNRFQHDNLFRTFGSDKRMLHQMAEEGNVVEKMARKIGNPGGNSSFARVVTGKAARDITGEGSEVLAKQGEHFARAYERGTFGTFGNIGSIARDFGRKTAAWEATKSLGRNMFKWEVTEGIQELIQEGSNQAIKDYYTDLYKGKEGDVWESINKGIESQMNVQGLKTFLMGAVTGRLISPISFGFTKLAESLGSDAADRKAIKKSREEALNLLNGFYANPARYAEEWVANTKVQNRAAEKMEEALDKGSRYEYNNAKDASFAKAVMSAKKLNMVESMVDTLREVGNNFNERQFRAAFMVDFTDENRRSVKDYMNKIATDVELFSKRYDQLQEEYRDLLPSYRYQDGDRERVMLANRAFQDALEWMATSEYRSVEAAKRGMSIMEETARKPAFAQTAYQAFRVMGDTKQTDAEIALLKMEIDSVADTTTEEGKALLDLKKEQLESLQEYKKYVTPFEDAEEDTAIETYDPVHVDKMAAAINRYLKSRNKEFKIDVDINDMELNDFFFRLNDFRRLKKSEKKFMDAYSLIANPKKFLQVYTRIQEALEALKIQKKQDIEKTTAQASAQGRNSNQNTDEQGDTETEGKTAKKKPPVVNKDDDDELDGDNMDEEEERNEDDEENDDFDETEDDEDLADDDELDDESDIDDDNAKNNKKKADDSFVFDGVRLQQGSLLENKNGYRYKVLSKQPKKVSGKKVILLRRIDTQKEFQVKSLKNYKLVKEKKSTTQQKRERSAKFKLERPAIPMSVYAHQRDKKAGAELSDNERLEARKKAEADLQDLLFNTPQTELLEKLSIHVTRNKKRDNETVEVAEQGKAGENRNLRLNPEPLSVQLLYDGKPIAYLSYYSRYQYQTNNGKLVPTPKLTKAQFSEIFNTSIGQPDHLFDEFLRSYKEGEKVYTILEDLLTAAPDKGSKAVTLKGEQIKELFDIKVSPGQYDWLKHNKQQPSIALKDFPVNSIEGNKVVLLKKRVYVNTAGNYTTKNVLVSEKPLTPQMEEKLHDVIQGTGVESDEEGTATGGMGSYLAIVELPNKQVRFLDLAVPRAPEKELETLTQKLNEQIARTINENVIINGQNIDVKEESFNEAFNEEVFGKIFVATRLQQKGVYIKPELNAEGNIEINYLNNKTTEEGQVVVKAKDAAKPLHFNTFQDLLDAMNEAIEEHNKKDEDEIRLRGVKILPEHIKVNIDADPSFGELSQLLVKVTPGVVKNIGISVRAKEDPEDRIEVKPAKKQTKPAKKEDKKRKKPEPAIPVEEKQEEKTTEKEEVAEQESTEPITVEEDSPAEEDNAEAGITEVNTVTPAAELEKVVEVQKEEQNADEQKTEAEEVKKQKVEEDVSTLSEEGKKLNNLEKMEEFVVEQQTQIFLQLLEANPEEDIEKLSLEVEKHPAVIAAKEQLNALLNELSAQKVLIADNIRTTDLLHNWRFKHWVKKNLPSSVISVKEMAVITDRMLSEGITIGRFVASLDELNNVKGTIEVGKRMPFKYHEAFHAVFRLLLTEDQIEKYLQLAKAEKLAALKAENPEKNDEQLLEQVLDELRKLKPDHYGIMTRAELEARYYEEYLADQFEAWKKDHSGIRNIFKWFFNLIQRLSDFFKAPFSKQRIRTATTRSEIEALFYDINSKKFKSAAVADNRFTEMVKAGEPQIALKAIKIGTRFILDENGKIVSVDEYLPESKAASLIGSVAATLLRRREKLGRKKELTVLLEEIMDDYARLYDKRRPHYLKLLQNKKTARTYFSISPELDKLNSLFTEGRAQIIDAVTEHLQRIELREQLIKEQGINRDKPGVKTMPQNLLEYLSSITVNGVDEYGNKYFDSGEPVVHALDVAEVYTGLQKAAVNAGSVHEMLLAMQTYARYNNGCKQFMDRFINDVALELTATNYHVNKNGHLFQLVTKAFEQQAPDHLYFIKSINKQRSIAIKPNIWDNTKEVVSSWYNSFTQLFESKLGPLSKEEKAAFIDKAVEGLRMFFTSADGFKVSDEETEQLSVNISNSIKDKLGINFHPMYLAYSLAAAVTEERRTAYQEQLVKTYSYVRPLTEATAKELYGMLKEGKNPFHSNMDASDIRHLRSDDNAAASTFGLDNNNSVFFRLAYANLYFDETIYSTGFKSANGERASIHQYPDFYSVKLNELKEAFNQAEEGTLPALFNDPYYASNYLLKQKEFRQMLPYLQIECIDGMGPAKPRSNWVKNEDDVAERIMESGILYADYSERDMGVNLMDLFFVNRQFNKKKEEKTREQKQKEKEEKNDNQEPKKEGETAQNIDPATVAFMTSRHVIQIPGNSDILYTVNLPVVPVVTVEKRKRDDKEVEELSLTPLAKEAMLEEVRREFEEIKRVAAAADPIEREKRIAERGTGLAKSKKNWQKEIAGYHADNTERDMPRGLVFTKTGHMLGDIRISLEMEAWAGADFKDYAKDVEKKIEEYWFGKGGAVDRMVEKLINKEIIYSERKGDKDLYQNILLPYHIYQGYRGKEASINHSRNALLNIQPGMAPHNVAQIIINDYLNTVAFNQLLHGNQAQQVNNSAEMSAHAGTATVQAPSAYFEITDPSMGIEHNGKKSHVVHIEDAGNNAGTIWVTVKALRYLLFGSGQLAPWQAELLDEIEQGNKPGAVKEGDNQAWTLPSVHLSYNDGTRNFKAKAFVLTKAITSYNDKGTWQPLESSRDLHQLREQLEEYEQKYNSFTMAVPTSSSYGEKANVAKDFQSVTNRNFQQLDNRFMRLNLSSTRSLAIENKEWIQRRLIAEQDDNRKLHFEWNNKGVMSGTSMTVKDLKQLYQKYQADSIKQVYEQARDEIFDLKDALDEVNNVVKLNKVTPRLASFLKKATQSLELAGEDSQILDFFSLDDAGNPVYNQNIALTADKFASLFYAYFSRQTKPEYTADRDIVPLSAEKYMVTREVLSLDEKGEPKVTRVIPAAIVQQHPGRYAVKNGSLSLKERFEKRKLNERIFIVDKLRTNMPMYALNKDNSIKMDSKGNGVILGYYDECITTAPSEEALAIMMQTGNVPNALSKSVVNRNPSSAAVASPMMLVDFLPAFYGNTGIFATPEGITTSFTNDLLHLKEKITYTKRNGNALWFLEDKKGGKLKADTISIHTYGEANTTEAAFEEFVVWHATHNKTIVDRLRNEQKTGKNSANSGAGEISPLDRVLAIMEDMGLPANAEAYQKEKKRRKRDINPGRIHNLLLDAEIKLLQSRSMTAEEHKASSAVATKPVMEVLDELTEKFSSIKDRLEQEQLEQDTIDAKIIAFRNGKEATEKVEEVQELLSVFPYLNTYNLHLRKEMAGGKALWNLKIDGIDFNSYTNKQAYNPATNVFDGENVRESFYSLVMAVNNDVLRGKLAATFHFNPEALGIVGNMIATGVPAEWALMFIMQPVIQDYYQEITHMKSPVKSGKDSKAAIHNVGTKTLKNLRNMARINKEDYKNATLTSAILEEGLSSDAVKYAQQYAVFNTFLQLQQQTGYYRTLTRLLKAVKEPSQTNFRIINSLANRLHLFDDDDAFNQTAVPIDFRAVLGTVSRTGDGAEGYDAVNAIHLAINRQLQQISKVVLLSNTDLFNYMKQAALANLDVDDRERRKFEQELDLILASYLGLRAYQKMLADNKLVTRLMSLSNGMIYEGIARRKPKGFMDIIEVLQAVREILPDNGFANKFLHAIPTHVIVGEKVVKDDGTVIEPKAIVKDDIVEEVQTSRDKVVNEDTAISAAVVTSDGEVVEGATKKPLLAENRYNKDGINKIETNTWSKLAPFRVEELKKDFLEIYHNEKTRHLAWAMFHYLLVKDGGLYNSGSFLRFIPGFMFKDLCMATEKVNEVFVKAETDAASDAAFKELFGVGKEELLNEFVAHHTMHQSNSGHIPKKLLTGDNSTLNYSNAYIKIDELERYIPPTYREVKGSLYFDLWAGLNKGTIAMVRKGREADNKKLSAVEKLNLKKFEKNLSTFKQRGFKVNVVEQKKDASRETMDEEGINDIDELEETGGIESGETGTNEDVYIEFPYIIKDMVDNTTLMKKEAAFCMLYSIDGKKIKNTGTTSFIDLTKKVARGTSAQYIPIEIPGSGAQNAATAFLESLQNVTNEPKNYGTIRNHPGFGLDGYRAAAQQLVKRPRIIKNIPFKTLNKVQRLNIPVPHKEIRLYYGDVPFNEIEKGLQPAIKIMKAAPEYEKLQRIMQLAIEQRECKG